LCCSVPPTFAQIAPRLAPRSWAKGALAVPSAQSSEDPEFAHELAERIGLKEKR
jgi:hypothetical protein